MTTSRRNYVQKLNWRKQRVLECFIWLFILKNLDHDRVPTAVALYGWEKLDSSKCDRDWRFSIEEHKEERREVVEYSKLRIWLWNETVESCQQHGIFFCLQSWQRSQTVHCCSIRVGVLVNTYRHGSDWPWQTIFKL